jgi:invasion protein IalB
MPPYTVEMHVVVRRAKDDFEVLASCPTLLLPRVLLERTVSEALASSDSSLAKRVAAIVSEVQRKDSKYQLSVDPFYIFLPDSVKISIGEKVRCKDAAAILSDVSWDDAGGPHFRILVHVSCKRLFDTVPAPTTVPVAVSSGPEVPSSTAEPAEAHVCIESEGEQSSFVVLSDPDHITPEVQQYVDHVRELLLNATTKKGSRIYNTVKDHLRIEFLHFPRDQKYRVRFPQLIPQTTSGKSSSVPTPWSFNCSSQHTKFCLSNVEAAVQRQFVKAVVHTFASSLHLLAFTKQ